MSRKSFLYGQTLVLCACEDRRTVPLKLAYFVSTQVRGNSQSLLLALLWPLRPQVHTTFGPGSLSMACAPDACNVFFQWQHAACQCAAFTTNCCRADTRSCDAATARLKAITARPARRAPPARTFSWGSRLTPSRCPWRGRCCWAAPSRCLRRASCGKERGIYSS